MKEIHKSCGGVMYDSITTLNWMASDNLENYLHNKKYFSKKMTAWNKHSITYTLNSYGFRNDFEFDESLSTKKNMVVLGCSNSFGIGLPKEFTWGSIVAKELGFNLVNLAVPGGSMDSAARVSYFWLEKINPELVLLQIPELSRKEFLMEDGLSIKGSWDRKWTKHLLNYADENEFYFNKIKNTIIIKSLLNKKTKFFEFDPWHLRRDLDLKSVDHARDLNHSGILTNKYLAQKVVDELERNIY